MVQLPWSISIRQIQQSWSFSIQVLDIFRAGDATIYLDSLLQCLTVFTGKIKFICSDGISFFFSLVLSVGNTRKNLAPSLFPHVWYLHTLRRSLLRLLFSRLKSPTSPVCLNVFYPVPTPSRVSLGPKFVSGLSSTARIPKGQF